MNREDLYEFQTQMRALNRALKEKYDPLFSMSKKDFKGSLTEEIGSLFHLDPLSEEELKNMGTVAGVDGSVTRSGGAHPHYIELFQGLALSLKG